MGQSHNLDAHWHTFVAMSTAATLFLLEWLTVILITSSNSTAVLVNVVALVYGIFSGVVVVIVMLRPMLTNIRDDPFWAGVFSGLYMSAAAGLVFLAVVAGMLISSGKAILAVCLIGGFFLLCLLVARIATVGGFKRPAFASKNKGYASLSDDNKVNAQAFAKAPTPPNKGSLVQRF